MARRPRLTQQQWLQQFFSSKSAQNGGVIRRKEGDVVKYASEAALKAEVELRDFHMVKNGNQYVVFCNSGDTKLIR